MRRPSISAAAVALVCAFAAGAGLPAQALPISSIVIDTPHGPARFKVEVAADDASRDNGLMYRKHLSRDAGMWFDFHRDLFVAFWMKNTPLPLDMIFIRSDGTISSVAPNAVPYSTSEIQSQEPIRAVLEINGGEAAALGIAPGERVHAAMLNGKPPHP